MPTKQSKAANHARRTLRLESFEDRLAPATLYVNTVLDDVTPNNGKFSLREAIDRANSTANADVIVLPAGSFNITIAGNNDDANLTGDFDITSPLTILGKGAGLTKIDGAVQDRVFDVRGKADAPINVTLRGLTITGGNAFDGAGLLMGHANVILRGCVVTKNTAVWSGGGISNLSNPVSGDLTLIGSIVSSNFSQGGDGGGIYLHGGTVTAWRSTIVENSAGASGGGIAGTAVNLTRCTVSGNDSVLWGGGVSGNTVKLTASKVLGNQSTDSGGGIFAGSKVELIRTLVESNTARLGGGGVHVEGGEIWATRSIVKSNTAGFGGGVHAVSVDLTNCMIADNNAGSDVGGGIHATTANLAGSTITGNNAKFSGGGIYAETTNLTSSTVNGNRCDLTGGGIHATTATLTNSTVTRNETKFSGGGIYARKVATLTNSTVSLNRAGGDGGGIFAGTEATVTRSSVSRNSAAKYGGGVSTQTAIVVDSTINDNQALQSGGGLRTEVANLTNTTVSNNLAGENGGGVYTVEGTLLNVTVADNLAAYGGGVYHVPGGQLWIRNTLIARNEAPGAGRDVYGAFDSLGHNLIGIVDGGTGFGSNADLLGVIGAPLDPRLGELRGNGGKTLTHALLAGSPAIDAGDNAGASALDQRGIRRIRDGNRDGRSIVDIGAFER